MKMFPVHHRCLILSAGSLLLTSANRSSTSFKAFAFAPFSSINRSSTCHKNAAYGCQTNFLNRHHGGGGARKRNHHDTTAIMMRNHYPTMDGKTLVSVEDCLEAYHIGVLSSHSTSSSSDDDDDDDPPPKIIFVDGSWYHRSKRSGRHDFEAGPRIVGAKYADMDDICAKQQQEDIDNDGRLIFGSNPKNLPHMMPTKELFAMTMDAMSITNNDYVIVYGRDGCVFTPRTWFLFQQMGHDPNKVKLMQGSLEEWIQKGGPIETSSTRIIHTDDLINNVKRSTSIQQTNYKARDPPNIVNMQDMLDAVRNGQNDGVAEDSDTTNADIILDPRGTTFDAGHIPSAINIPYRSIVTKDDLLKFKSKHELETIFEKAGVNVHTDQRILLSCGTGVSVCHLYLALQECGRDNTDKTFVYDGSWAEWGADDSTPKATTPVSDSSS